MTSEIIDLEFAKARKAAAKELRNRPVAVSAWYDPDEKLLMVKLSNRTLFGFPPGFAQGLNQASASQLANVEISPAGLALHWPDLDADLSLEYLMQGIFGARAWMSALARKAGSAKSLRKAVAARENGKKGGRPRKDVQG